MFNTLKNKIAFKFINFGISMLPENMQNEKFINNTMKTGHIKLANKGEA